MIPWELVVAYFGVALLLVLVFGYRGASLKSFSTRDLLFVGVGGAASVAWEFYIGGFFNRFIPASLPIHFTFLGRLIIVFIVAAAVRKVGTGMLTLLIFNLLSDLFYYGFSGEPVYTVYECLTYGLFIDLMIAFTGGRLFGIIPGRRSSTGGGGGTEVRRGLSLSQVLVGMTEGAVLGISWAIPDPIFYSAFFSPFLYGGTVNLARVLFHLVQFIPGDIVAGVVAALIAQRLVRALGL